MHLINIGEQKETEKLYYKMLKNGIDVLWDDREDKRPGEKFADSDLIGISYRLVVSKKSLEQGGCELKKRDTDEFKIISDTEVLNLFSTKSL